MHETDSGVLSVFERAVLRSLHLLHRKLDILNQSDVNLTTATNTLASQLQAFEADITTGLASVVAALNAKTTPAGADPAVEAATTALNAMGAGITGSKAAFDAAVAAAVPASPTAPVPTPAVPVAPAIAAPTDSATATAAPATTAPITQPVLDAMAVNAQRAPEQTL